VPAIGLPLQGAQRGGRQGVPHGLADEVVPIGQQAVVLGQQVGAQKIIDRRQQRRRRLVQHRRQVAEGEPPSQHRCHERGLPRGLGQPGEPVPHAVGDPDGQPCLDQSGVSGVGPHQRLLLQAAQQFHQQERVAVRAPGQRQEARVGLRP
jgi:hypothetical protein